MDLEAELMGDYSVEEIKAGFVEEPDQYTCLICGQSFDKGEIFTFNGKLYEGHKAVKVHIKEQHESVEAYLLKTKSSHLGISDLQLQLINLFASGMSDKEIAEKLGVSSSTIRNHRYKLRERERQSKLFLALMESLNKNELKNSSQPERERENCKISDKDKKRILERYMTESGKLKMYPSVEKMKRVLLENICGHFKAGKNYTEDEVKGILGEIYKDYKLLRDEMIAYGYLGRTNQGAVYWLKTAAKN